MKTNCLRKFKPYALLVIIHVWPLFNAVAQVKDTAYHMSDTIHSPGAYLDYPIAIMAPNGELNVIHTISQAGKLNYRVDAYDQNNKLWSRTQSENFAGNAGYLRNAKIDFKGLVVAHSKNSVFFQKRNRYEVNEADDAHRRFSVSSISSMEGDILDVVPNFVNHKYYVHTQEGTLMAIDTNFPSTGSTQTTYLSHGSNKELGSIKIINGYGYIIYKSNNIARIHKLDLSAYPITTVYDISLNTYASSKAYFLGEWNGKIIYYLGGKQIVIDAQNGSSTSTNSVWNVPVTIASYIDGDTLKILTNFSSSSSTLPSLYEYLKLDLTNDSVLAHGYQNSLLYSTKSLRFVHVNDTLVASLEQGRVNSNDIYCSLFNLKKMAWAWQTPVVPMISTTSSILNGYYSPILNQLLFYQSHYSNPTTVVSGITLAGNIVSRDTLYDPTLRYVRDLASGVVDNKIYSAVLSDTALTRFRFQNGINRYVGKSTLPKLSTNLFAGKKGDYVVFGKDFNTKTIYYFDSTGTEIWSYNTQNTFQELKEVEFSNNRIAFVFYHSKTDGKLVNIDYAGNVIFEIDLPSISGYAQGNLQIELLESTNQTLIAYLLSTTPAFSYRVRLYDATGNLIYLPSPPNQIDYRDIFIRQFESRMLIIEGDVNSNNTPIKIHELKGPNFNSRYFSVSIPSSSERYQVKDAHYYNSYYYLTTLIYNITSPTNQRYNIIKLDTLGVVVWQKIIEDGAWKQGVPRGRMVAIDSSGIHMFYPTTRDSWNPEHHLYRRLDFNGNQLDSSLVPYKWASQNYIHKDFQTSPYGPFAIYAGGIYGGNNHNATLYLPGKNSSLFLGNGEVFADLPQRPLKILPNPARGSCEVILDIERNYPVETALYSSTGKLVFTKAFNPQEPMVIDLKNLSSGVYVILVRGNESIYTGRIVVTN